MLEQIKSLELSLLNKNIRKNVDKLNNLIADDFIEFGSSGKVYTKSDVIQYLPNEIEENFEASNFNGVQLARDCILLTYLLYSKHGKSLRSSIWKRYDGNWKIIFHQGTLVQ